MAPTRVLFAEKEELEISRLNSRQAQFRTKFGSFETPWVVIKLLTALHSAWEPKNAWQFGLGGKSTGCLAALEVRLQLNLSLLYNTNMPLRRRFFPMTGVRGLAYELFKERHQLLLYLRH